MTKIKALRANDNTLTDFECILVGEALESVRKQLLTRFSRGVITALPVETAAIESCFDNIEKRKMRGISFKIASFTTKDQSEKKVLVLLKQTSDVGNNMAAICAMEMKFCFPNLENIILVGIAGGVPFPENPDMDVRLGDVVVSDQQGITQYDLGKQEGSIFVERSRGRPPSPSLIEAVNELSTKALRGQEPWLKYIDELASRLGWARPDDETDNLYFEEDIKKQLHADAPSLQRISRIFRGKIGSANIVLKSREQRQEIRSKHGVIAVEMEGSGIADATWKHTIGYLVIRGICDYADQVKNDLWQKYAAIAAAGYCKALLEEIQE